MKYSGIDPKVLNGGKRSSMGDVGAFSFDIFAGTSTRLDFVGRDSKLNETGGDLQG